MKKRKRAWSHPEPDKSIAPVYVPAGFYLGISDYARREGIAILTARNRIARGEVAALRFGRRNVLVKI